MTAYTDTLQASGFTAGQTGSVQYQVTGADGTVHQAFTATGITEKATTPGTYTVRGVALDTAWLPIEIDWQNTVTGDAASEVLKSPPSVLTTVNAIATNINPGSYVLRVVLQNGGTPSASNVPLPYKIIVARGTSMPMSVPVFQADGVTPQDLTGWHAVLMVKASADDPDSTTPTVGKALIYKDNHTIGGITIPTPANGMILFTIVPADTYEEEPFELFPQGTLGFVWGLKLYDPSGTLQPPGAGGSFVVQDFPVHSQSAPT